MLKNSAMKKRSEDEVHRELAPSLLRRRGQLEDALARLDEPQLLARHLLDAGRDRCAGA